MNVVLRTPEGEVYHGAADCVTLRTDGGEMQILPGHVSLQATVSFTPVRVRNGASEEVYLAQRGFLAVHREENEVVLSVFSCEKRSEMSYMTAKEYMEFVMEALQKGDEASLFEKTYLEQERIATQERIAFLENKTQA